MKIFFEALGWAGSFCFLFSYYMLITKEWDSGQRIYHWYNIIGSFLFVANGTYYLAWSVIFINFAWGCIACYGLYDTYRADKE
jgi:hypothetical protein